MVGTLAEELYLHSISLKRYDSRRLRSRAQRATAAEELAAVHRLVESLLRCLRDSKEFPEEYSDLALFMDRSFFECTLYLVSGDKSSRKKAVRCIFALHNLPRAFLPAGNNARITPAEAKEYFESYILFR